MKNNWSDRLHSGAQQPIKIHLIGVAGSGMSGIAGLLLSLGHEVSGSDMGQGSCCSLQELRPLICLKDTRVVGTHLKIQ